MNFLIYVYITGVARRNDIPCWDDSYTFSTRLSRAFGWVEIAAILAPDTKNGLLITIFTWLL